MTDSASERVLKIGLHMAELQIKVCCLPFMRHSVHVK